MSDRHVVPAEDGWHVEKDHAQRASAKTPTQAEAVRRAVEIVANDGGGQVLVHGVDGEIRENRTGADDIATTGRKIAAETGTAARNAAATAQAGASGVADEATAALEGEKSARAAGKDAAAIAATIGGQISERAERTGRQLRGEAAASGRRTWAQVDAIAEQAQKTLIREADRAEVVGTGVSDELESAADRAGRYIHTVTERAAGPLDAASDAVLAGLGRVNHAVNPVRVTGRAVGVLVAGGVHVASRAVGRGGRVAQRAAHAVTDD